MKKKQKKQRRGVSAGTIIMLLLTALVLAGSAGFMAMIAGEALRSRAGEAIDMARRAGLTLMSEAEGRLLYEKERAAGAGSVSPAKTAQPEATPQPRAQEVSTFTLAAAGTIHAPKAVRDGAMTEAGEYDFDAVFAGLGDALERADLSIATLETTVAGGEKGEGSYNAPASLLDALRERGVDLLSLGTERALDEGYDGLTITAAELTARGIAYAGASPDGERRSGIVGSIGGVQVAVLAYSYGVSDEGREKASEQELDAVALLEMSAMEQDIRQARADGANVVIVMPHWGTKNKLETPDEVRRLARAMAEAGADVILGTHPNVVQGTERLRVTRADGLEYETVVCYSLGSLLTDARTEENTAGMIAQMQISYDPGTRRVSLGSLACLPVYIARQKEDGQNVFRVVDVESAQGMSLLTPEEQEEAQRAAQRVREITGQSEMENEGQG